MADDLDENISENRLAPLHVFRFEVTFSRDTLSGGSSGSPVPLCSGAFAECTGLEATMEPKVIKAGGQNYGPAQRAGQVSFATVILKRGMTTTRDLWRWFQLVAGGAYAYRLAAEITMQDQAGKPVLTWKLARALAIKFKAADLNARGTEIGVEELHLAHEGLSLVDTGRPLDGRDTRSGRRLAGRLQDHRRASRAVELPGAFQPGVAAVHGVEQGDRVRAPRRSSMSARPAPSCRWISCSTPPTRAETCAWIPVRSSSCSHPTPRRKKRRRMVEFSWGTYSFTGVIEQYKETLDFFSADGVPLRASVSLTLSSKELTFADPDRAGASVDGDVTPDTVDVAEPAGGGPQDSPASIANALGAPRAARAIAAANGAASLRFGVGRRPHRQRRGRRLRQCRTRPRRGDRRVGRSSSACAPAPVSARRRRSAAASRSCRRRPFRRARAPGPASGLRAGSA